MRFDSTLDVFVGVASIPEREGSLRKVIDRLHPQARTIGVYLNGYREVPAFLKRERIVVERSQQHGDVRDNGKFFFLGRSQHRYYATVDDDILYPKDYLEVLIEQQASIGGSAAVGVHGALYPDPVIDLFDARLLMHFEHSAPYLFPVHLLGTGTTLIDQSVWNLRFDEFGTPGMADVWFARAASERSAHCYVVPRRRKWLEPIRQERGGGGALFHEGLHQSREQVELLSTAGPSSGGADALLDALGAAANGVGLHQATQFARVCKQLGFAPANEASAGRFRAAATDGLLGTTAGAFEQGELDRYLDLVSESLARRVDPVRVEAVVPFLDKVAASAQTRRPEWDALPLALRNDTQPHHYAEVRSALLSGAMGHSAEAARALWPLCAAGGDVRLDQALAASRAGCETRFERLPEFTRLAAAQPVAAAKHLYEFLQIEGDRRPPDVSSIRSSFGSDFETPEVLLPVIQAAARSGAVDLARSLTDQAMARWPSDPDVRLISVRLDSEQDSSGRIDPRPALAVLDELVGRAGLGTWTDLHDPDHPGHWIDAFRATVPAPEERSPDVSVIMTTRNDEGQIRAAIASILASVGVAVELVIVDDCSTDGTADLLRSIDDPRVAVISNDRNVGPYVSRNIALEKCRAPFVAIADADDFSHPERLRYQVAALESAPHVHACKVAHVRVRANGEIDLENNARFLGDGPMSLMYRRWITDHIGAFDRIRTRGDVEFMRRLQARFGTGALVSFGVPLVLASSSPLSNSKRFSDDSLDLYRAAFRQWHERLQGRDGLYVPLRGGRAPFLAPFDLVV